MALRRRQILSGLSLGLAGLLLRPAQARALGGTAPSLGEPAPDFTLEGVVPLAAPEAAVQADSAAEAAVRTAQVNLADFRGRWLVLYFYPRDFTSGCTLEARGFQRNLEAFHAASAEVVGVSADGTDDHAAFCGSEGLVYPLLSDRGGQVSRRYGSWLAPFSLRHTFLIDPEGVLRASWTAVRPAGHASEVLAELQRLQIADHGG
ncbi:MAG: peroxiredoxin [Cyanobium sp.]